MQPEQLQYHRLIRGIKKYRWWKPAVFALLAAVFGFTLTQIVTTIGILPLVLRDGVDGIESVVEIESRLIALDTQDPYALGLALLSLVVWIPAILLAAWAMGFAPVGRLWSVAFRVRWRLLFTTLVPAFISLILVQAVGMIYAAVGGFADEEVAIAEDFSRQSALISLVLVLILVPFQAAAEELMFRGALMQILGAWIKSPVIPIVLPSLLFALAHLYDPWALVQVGILGIVAGWLTWRTGGLEAAISLHVINNLVVFLLLLTGITGETSQSQDTGADVIAVLIQAASFVLYAMLVLRITHKMGITAPMRQKR